MPIVSSAVKLTVNCTFRLVDIDCTVSDTVASSLNLHVACCLIMFNEEMKVYEYPTFFNIFIL